MDLKEEFKNKFLEELLSAVSVMKNNFIPVM